MKETPSKERAQGWVIAAGLVIVLAGLIVILSRPGGESPSGLAKKYERYWKRDTAMSAADERAMMEKLPFERIALDRQIVGLVSPEHNFRVVFHRTGLAELEKKGAPSGGPPIRQLGASPSPTGGSGGGRFTGQIHPSEYARLCYLIQKNGFEKLGPRYDGGATDSEEVTVTVTGSSGDRAVYAGAGEGPVEFWIIQRTIEGVKATTDWSPVK